MKAGFTVLLLILVLLLVSCGQSVSQDTGTAAGTFGEKDLVFVFDGAGYQLKTDAAPLLKALGNDYKLEAAISCVYKGDDKTFTYSGIVLYTNPINGNDVFYEIDITGGDYGTSKGIKIGSTLDEVKAAYGTGFDADSSYVYYLSGNKDDLKSPQLVFDYDENGKVTLISYYDPSNIK